MDGLGGGVAQMFNGRVCAGDELGVGLGLDLEYLEYGDEGERIGLSLGADDLCDEAAEVFKVTDRRLVLAVLVVDLSQLQKALLEQLHILVRQASACARLVCGL